MQIIAFYVFISIYYFLWCSSLILLSGNIKPIQVPFLVLNKCFSTCHWNLNCIAAHNYAKQSLLSANNLVHSLDIICLSETSLNSQASPNGTRLELPGYNMFLSDHSSNNKRGDIYIYSKSTLPLRILNISNLDECITFEI